MLILTRKVNEAILIGDDIKIMVTGLMSGRAQIGIVAPPNVKVLREELTAKPENSVICTHINGHKFSYSGYCVRCGHKS